MQHTPFEIRLRDCVLSHNPYWTGQAKLEKCSTEDFELLSKLPGVSAHMGSSKHPDIAGYYAPYSILWSGIFGGNLEDYELESNAVMPSGRVLRNHQRRSVAFLRMVTREREGAMLVASPGLGKTSSALHALHLDNYLSRPGIVVAPKIAQGVWCDSDSDAKRHYGLNITPLEGVKYLDVEQLDAGGCFFCHFEIIDSWQTWIFHRLKPAWLIVDESHCLTNPKAKCTKAVMQLSLTGTIERRYLLTGTAIANSRMDLWSQLAIAQPHQWGASYHSFGVRFCNGIKMAADQGGHWTYDGESNTDELRARLAGTYLRYTADDVADELPKMERHVINADIDNDALWDDYMLAQRDISKYMREKSSLPAETAVIKIGNLSIKLNKNEQKAGAARLVCTNTLIGILSEMKVKPAVKAVDTLMQTHNRIVIFTWRRKTAAQIHAALSDHIAAGKQLAGKGPLIYGPVDGVMDMPVRKNLARQFAESSYAIFVATMKSAGTSINTLSAASAGLIIDLHWNTNQLIQAEKRIHRDGCQADKVDLFYLTVKNTVDDLFIEALIRKAKAAVNVSDKDNLGMNLVRDLSPEDTGEFDFEAFCDQLMAID